MELPEVEGMRRDLEKEVVGKRVKEAEVRPQRNAMRVIRRLFWPRMQAYARGEGDRDYKTSLQEQAAQDLGRIPEYRVAERGPDHQKEFTATVYLGGKEFGRGVGRSKKEAEQQAAGEALQRLTEGGAPAPAER